MTDETLVFLICAGIVVFTVGLCLGTWIGGTMVGNVVRKTYRETLFTVLVPLVNRAREHTDHDDDLADDFRKLDEVAWLHEVTGL